MAFKNESQNLSDVGMFKFMVNPKAVAFQPSAAGNIFVQYITPLYRFDTALPASYIITTECVNTVIPLYARFSDDSDTYPKIIPMTHQVSGGLTSMDGIRVPYIYITATFDNNIYPALLGKVVDVMAEGLCAITTSTEMLFGKTNF